MFDVLYIVFGVYIHMQQRSLTLPSPQQRTQSNKKRNSSDIIFRLIRFCWRRPSFPRPATGVIQRVVLLVLLHHLFHTKIHHRLYPFLIFLLRLKKVKKEKQGKLVFSPLPFSPSGRQSSRRGSSWQRQLRFHPCQRIQRFLSQTRTAQSHRRCR